jgi:hypothetical protein
MAAKLAVHFVADDPDPGLVTAMEAAFRDSGGDLVAVTAALLAHPAALGGSRRQGAPAVRFHRRRAAALGVPGDEVIGRWTRRSSAACC